MKNIIIFGQAGAGKSTVANLISELMGNERMSLGAKIHAECKLHGKHTRAEMQNYGQSMREIFGELVWCDYLMKMRDKDAFIVIDDGRQLNEYAYFKTKDFVTIGLIADFSTRAKRIKDRSGYELTYEMNYHTTESQASAIASKCDLIIYNDGSREELQDKVKKICGNI